MSNVPEQMNTSSAISRERYNVMRFAAIGLGLGLIVAVFVLFFNQPKVPLPLPLPEDVWLEDQLPITVTPDVVEKLKNLGIGTVVYINNKAQIRVTRPDGTPVDVCADLRGTEIVERPGKSCGLKGITPRNFLQILYFTYNPGCASAGGNLGC